MIQLGVFVNRFLALMERFPNNNAKNCDRVTATYEQSSDASEAGWAIGPSGVMG